MSRIGRYRYFGSNDDQGWEPDLLVLDQNICLHIAMFYFGQDCRHRPDLQKLLTRFPYSKHFSRTHISSGWGIEELSWKRTGEFDAKNTRYVRWATERVLSWDPDRVAFEFGHRHPPVDRDKKWRQGVPLPSKDRHPLYAILASYAPMLRLCSLFNEKKRRGKDGGEWAFNKYTDWMMNEFGYQLAYESALAAYTLLDKNKQAQARGIFHIGGNETPDELADKAWAAAWDMQYARLVDMGPMGLMGFMDRKFKNIAVATEDSDPHDSKMRAQLIETIRNCAVYLMPSGVKIPESEFSCDLGYGVSFLRRTTPRKAGCDPLAALDSLERSMGVQRRTLSAFREYPGEDASPAFLARLAKIEERPTTS